VTYSLHYVTVALTYPCVAESPDVAQRFARAEVENALTSAPLAVAVSSVLATSPVGEPECSAELPLWEYPDVHEMPDTAEEWRDPDFVVPSKHHRRRWTVRRWLAEQERTEQPAPIAPVAPEAPRTVDDWRTAPSLAEVAAHHAAHADGADVSRWVMLSKRDPAVVCVYTGRLGFRAHEDTRWRPCDATLTPVAWPVADTMVAP
jgi:hypothetical protein